MNDRDRFDTVVRAFGEQREVILVSASVVYEGFIEYFKDGVASAVVRVVTGEDRRSTRFKRDFRLDDIDDVALIETEDPEPEVVFDIPPSNGVYGVETDHEAAALVRLSEGLVMEAAQRKRLVPEYNTDDLLASALRRLTAQARGAGGAPPSAPHPPTTMTDGADSGL